MNPSLDNGEVAAGLDDRLEQWRPWLTRRASRMIASAVRPKMSESDLVQGTYLAAVQDWEHFHGETESQLRGWLLKVMTNQLREGLRRMMADKRDIRRECSLTGMETLPDNRASSLPAINAEEAERILTAIGQLPAEHRAVVEFRYLEGISFEEIGSRLALSRHAVGRRWVAALSELNLLLRDE